MKAITTQHFYRLARIQGIDLSDNYDQFTDTREALRERSKELIDSADFRGAMEVLNLLTYPIDHEQSILEEREKQQRDNS